MPNNNQDRPSPGFPKKRFGQHFLTDRNIIKKIVRAAGVKEGDLVLEIGPGRGALTEGLIEAGAKVVAIEVDRDLIAHLKGKFPAGKLEIITADALKVSFLDMARERGARLKSVSNLPYNISTPILTKLLAEREAFSLLVLMFQKEVAERLTSRPGTKEYGLLTVMSQLYADIRIEFNIPRHLFTPSPKVDSSVVSFSILDTPRVKVCDEAFFKALVASAFGTRRKILANSLKTLGLDKDTILSALEENAIDPKRRGETLSLVEFSALESTLLRRRGAKNLEP